MFFFLSSCCKHICISSSFFLTIQICPLLFHILPSHCLFLLFCCSGGHGFRNSRSGCFSIRGIGSNSRNTQTTLTCTSLRNFINNIRFLSTLCCNGCWFIRQLIRVVFAGSFCSIVIISSSYRCYGGFGC